MQLEQLQAFLAVAETGSFQQAARKCGVTQSTISRQVQGLEADLGLPLFHRTAQAKLTLGGERLLPRAKKICSEWQNAHQELSDLMAGKQPELCIAAIHSVCAYSLPPVLLQFAKDFSDVQLRVTSLGSDRALKVLKDGLVDLAIVMNNRFLTASPDLIVESLYNEPIEVLMAANHPLTQYENIPWTELGRYQQVLFKDGYGMQRLVQDQFDRRGMKLQAALELNTLDAFRCGELIAIFPQTALIEAQLDPTLAIRKIETTNDTGISRQVVVVTSRDRLQIPPIGRFYQLVKELMPAYFTQLTSKNSPSLSAHTQVA